MPQQRRRTPGFMHLPSASSAGQVGTSFMGTTLFRRARKFHSNPASDSNVQFRRTGWRTNDCGFLNGRPPARFRRGPGRSTKIARLGILSRQVQASGLYIGSFRTGSL